jgi:tetratricopeptide (TPR) repeat protein
MRPKIYLSLALSLTILTVIDSPSFAKARRGGGGAPGGGVILQTPNPQTPVEHNNRGVELGQKGIWADAIREHEIALQMDPYNTQWRTNLSAAHLEYGKFLNARGKKDLAMAEFRKAMIIDPANAAADAELDKVLYGLRRNADDPGYRTRLADDADVAGQYDTAIVEWRKVAKMTDSPSAHARLGYVLLKAGGDANTVAGYKELRTAVGRNDWAEGQKNELSIAHAKLGEILKDFALKAKDKGLGQKGMQRLYNAAAEYRRAVTLNPNNPDAKLGLIQCAQMAVAIRPSFDNHLFLGGAYLLAEKFPQAQAEYKECFRLNPRSQVLDSARVAFHQAISRSAMSSPEQVAESVTQMKKLIDDEPNNARYFYILGRLRERQVEQGSEPNYDKAKKCYEKALSINPLIDPDLKIAMSRIGAAPAPNAPVPKANPEESKKAMEIAAKEKMYTDFETEVEGGADLDATLTKGQELFGKNSKDGRIAGLLGRIYEKKGDPNSAKSWYRIGAGLGDPASQRFAEQVDANRVLDKLKDADGLLAQNKYIDAKSIYQDILIIAPKRADVHRKLGDCLKGLGDSEGAKKEYSDADLLDRGITPTDKAAEPAKTGGDAAPPSKDKIADKASKPVEEQGAKAEALQMQPLKKKK